MAGGGYRYALHNSTPPSGHHQVAFKVLLQSEREQTLVSNLETEMAAITLFYLPPQYHILIMRVFWGEVFIITSHAQRERDKVIGCGVHMFVNEKNIGIVL